MTEIWSVSGSEIGEITGSTNFIAFNQAGITEVTLSVDDNKCGTDTASSLVVVYDPYGGFVTGGGWFDSPAGACSYNTCLTDTIGKATFGFVSKYNQGATNPNGNTEFQFKAGNLNFHSTSYQWLVVTGSNYARFKGSGTINNELAPIGEVYKFLIWAGDGDPDTFRIRIWYEEGGNEIVVYDNGFDQPIGGGSVVIHTN